MLSMQQRQQIAQQMTVVREKLRALDPDLLISDIAPDLQKAVRSFPVIGPITSSGLEHIYQIFNRFDFAISGLLDEDYIVEESGKHYLKPQATPPAATPPAPVPTPPAPETSTEQTQSGTVSRLPQLNFGPFDPRKEPDAKN